eukprot:sb/3476677/
MYPNNLIFLDETTRVRLQGPASGSGNDYINANYVKDLSGQVKFIATQSILITLPPITLLCSNPPFTFVKEGAPETQSSQATLPHRRCFAEKTDGPVVVHCSAGTDRIRKYWSLID